MSEIEIRDKILKHSLQILRLSAGEQAQVDAVIRQLSDELKTLLQSQVLSEAGKRQIEGLIKDAEGLIGKAYKTAGASADTHAIALVIADKTVEALAELGPSAIAPSPERLAALTKDVMIDGAQSSAWWARQAEDTAFKFAGQVRQGVINGETNERIVQRIVGKRGEPGIMDVSRRNARTLVHSSIMSAMNEARLATYRKNSRFIKGLRYLATLDGHVCNRCAALDGQAWDLEGDPLPGTKVDFLPPPLHFSCFPADTRVLSRRSVTGASKRWFDGEVVVIKTAAGRELTCTPNHPIMTDSGWVAAGALNVGGNVVCDGGSEWEGLANGNGENAPALIHDVTESFFASRKVSAMPVEVSAEDFHGDGVGSKVAVIWSDSLLRHKIDAPCYKHFRQSLFINGSSAGLVGFTRGRALAQRFETWLSPLHDTISALGHLLPFFGGSAPHPRKLLGTSVAQINAVRLQNDPANSNWDAMKLGNSRNADALHIGFDDVCLATACGGQGTVDGGFTLTPQSMAVGNEDSVHSLVVETQASGDSVAGLPFDVGVNDALVGRSLLDVPAKNDATGLEFGSDSRPGALELGSDFFARPPAQILLDNIVNIDVRSFTGHVYNLETSGGWYVAQGIVVHNCRCILSPIPKNTLGLDFGPDTRASAQGPITGDTSFGAYLKRLTPAQIEEQFGKGRAELLRSGRITVKDLVSGTGRELSLDELRKI